MSLTVPETSTSSASETRGEASGDVNGEAAHVVSDELALAAVDPGPHLEPDVGEPRLNREGTADRRGRQLELDQEAVPDCLDLLSP